MASTVRREIQDLIEQLSTTTRRDFDASDVEIFCKSLIVAFTGTWHYSSLTADTHLYRDVRWGQGGVERYREALEELFGIEIPQLQFLCARTVGDVRDQVLRVLRREGRAMSLRPPAA